MKRVFYEWSSDDVESIAEGMGIELTDDKIKEICEELENSLNDWDSLNEMITDEINKIIKEYRED